MSKPTYPYYTNLYKAVEKYEQVHGSMPKMIRMAPEAKIIFGYYYLDIPIAYMSSWKQGFELI